MAFLLNLCRDYSALWHCGNCTLTSESPKISTRRPQTPDKGLWILCHKCHTLEVCDGFHLSGKIEGSQTRVTIGVEGLGLQEGIGELKRLGGV